ncbi:protein kinase, partial [Planctomycetota bacterium]
MRIKCPSCAKTFKVPKDSATGKTKCPHCGQKLDLGRMERPEDLSRGDRLGGCRIEGLLGRGGMAVVYKATQLSLDRAVALKVLPRQLARNRQFVDRFNREAAALARLSHPNIVSILDKGVEGETYFFVMEYVEGRSLRDHLRHQGPLAPEDTLELMNGICAALEYAHDNHIVHRDLKPSNILLDPDGMPKLADFGIARIVTGGTTLSRGLTVAHSAMGSADYMAPEQREDAANVDHRADIYALGVVLYQMLTGRLPVGTFTPASRLNPAVPVAADRVIRKALANSPDDRFESASLFRAALAQALHTVHARGPGTGRHHVRTSSRPATILLVVGIVAAVAIFAGLLIAQRNRGRAVEPPPRKPPKRPPGKRPAKPKGESKAVKEALADVRSYIAQNPNDYKGQLDRLTKLIVSHNNLDVVRAAKKEREAIIKHLNQEITDNLTQLEEQSDALADKGDFGPALRIFEAYPQHLRTAESVERLNASIGNLKTRARNAFAGRKLRVAALVKQGKAAEAAQLIRPVKSWGLPDLAAAADKLLGGLSIAVAAETRRVAIEQVAVRRKLAGDMKALWAERKYADALALVKPALAQAPNGASRLALARYQRAGALLAGFWIAAHKGAKASVGKPLRINGGTWTVVDFKESTLQLSMGSGAGQAKVGRSLKSLSVEDLARLASYGADRAKPDTHLMLALFYSHDKQPDPAEAKRSFDAARARGGKRTEIDALRTLGIEAEPADPTKPTPVDVGFALHFNGTSDYVEVADKRPNPLHLKSFTIEAWVWRRPGGAATQYVAVKNLGSAGALSYGIGISAGAGRSGLACFRVDAEAGGVEPCPG